QHRPHADFEVASDPQNTLATRRGGTLSAHIQRVKLRCADPLQEFHLGERFLLWRFRRHSVRQPYRVSEETWFGNMTKSPTRELLPQTNEEQPPRHRNVYDYDGEYEFPSAQHWTAPDVLAPPARCPLYPQKRTSGLTRGMSALCQKRTLADYPITSSGECEQGRRHINAKRFCGFEIDCHLKFGRKLHRKVAGRSALQYAIDVGGCATMQVR